jgi:hypothetical protein
MNQSPTHYGSTLTYMNISTKYDSSGWITNSNLLKSDKEYKLYATNNASIANGRDYVALPQNLVITHEVKKKYNLI